MAEERLLASFHSIMRMRHFSVRTEKSYRAWIVRYVRFCGMRHPRDCGSAEIGRFLDHLATVDEVAAATQNQAFAALLFLYRTVLAIPMADVPAYARAKRGTRLPEVLDPADVAAVLEQLDGMQLTIAKLLYGTGLRLTEAVSLRAKDIDLERRVVIVHDGKGGKDRKSVLPTALVEPLRAQLEVVRRRHHRDIALGAVGSWLPGALDRKYPSASRDWRWAWLFPSGNFVRSKRAIGKFRWHVYPTTVQRAVSTAARAAQINKRVTPQIFRHSFATQLLRSGYDIRTVQVLLGHRDVTTTMIYLHVLETGTGVRSPLDLLEAPARPRLGRVHGEE
ncbi:MAG: integron integrase [Gemmatimonadaceae bacterium]